MADTEKKISELDSAAQINTDDITVLSQGSAGTGFASVKATILAIANKIVSGINFSSALQTTDKTITGAINEVAQGGGGGASDLDDLSDVSITNPSNGQVLKYNSTSQEWENANESGGGSGGHTILDNDGTALAQEDDLQFAGTYSEDDSTNGKTVVNITREMTQAAYDLLSADEKAGIIRITDDDYVCGVDEVLYGEDGQGQDVTLGDYLDSLVEGHTVKNDTGTSLTQRDNLKFVGVYTSDDSTNNKTDVQIIREFSTVAEIEALTGEEAKGIQYVEGDADYIPFDAKDIQFDNTGTSYLSDDVDGVLREVDTRLKPRVVKNIPADTYNTYALALAELETYYDSLTSLEKATAYIMRGNVKANINVTYDKTFSYVNINAGNLINTQVYDLTNHEFNYAQTTTSGTTFGSLTSSAQSQQLTLYTIA